MKNEKEIKTKKSVKSILKTPKNVNAPIKIIKPYITHSKNLSSLDTTTSSIKNQNKINNINNNSQKDLLTTRKTSQNQKVLIQKATIFPKKAELKNIDTNTKRVKIQIPIPMSARSSTKKNDFRTTIYKNSTNLVSDRNTIRKVVNRENSNRLNKTIDNTIYMNTTIENNNSDKKNVFNIVNKSKKIMDNKKKENKIQRIESEYKNKNKNEKMEYKIKKVIKVNNFVSKKSKEKKLAELERQKIDKELEALPTFKKIVILQKLLKEMRSIKERFKDNKNNLIEKIYNNCYKYYKSKIYIKEIIDYCILRNPEQHNDYLLVSDNKHYLNDNFYQSLYDFLFLIRNNNYLMLKIIEFCDKNIYEELSDFFVDFLYENVINSSFPQDELILMIYLLIENLFSNVLPNKINLNNNNIYIKYINKDFLFYVFQQITRKIDVRNFLFSILSGDISKMENYRASLSLDINIVNRYLRNREINAHHSYLKFAEGDSKNETIRKMKKNFKKRKIIENSYNHAMDGGGNRFLKRTKRITLGESTKNLLSDSWYVVHSKMSKSKSLNDSSFMNDSNNNIDINKSIENNELKSSDKNLNKISINLFGEDYSKSIEVQKENNEEDNNKNEDENIKNTINTEENNSVLFNLNINQEMEKEKEEIDPFFEANSVNLQYLKNKLVELRKSLNKNAINAAMKEYIKSLIVRIKHPEIIDDKNDDLYMKYMNKESMSLSCFQDNIEDDDKEIFSTSLIIEELKRIREIKQPDSFRHLMKRINFNYRIVTKIISNLISKIKSNLISIPYIIKCISKILNTLIDKKYNIKLGNKLSSYNLYMFKINFFIGNIILPIIKNPETNGLITANVISKLTRENLRLISDIFNMLLSGQLFNKNNNPYNTLFNKYIIEIMPQLFELVESIDKNIKLPRKIQKLIDQNIKDNNNNNNERNINFDYFKENPLENIQYQSICFSWQNIFSLLDIISKNTKFFIDENKNEKEKKIFENFMGNRDKIMNLFSEGLLKQKKEFFLLTKIKVKEEFEKQKLKELNGDYFSLIIPEMNDDLITAYKKCVAEVLCYVDILNEVNFLPFTFRKDEVIYDKDFIKLLSVKERKNEYEKIVNNNTERTNYLNNMPLILKYEEDADFKNIIFPEMLKIITHEISFNLDNPISQRIIFCCNYLKLYMRNIPEKYKQNNFCQLFMELIKETQKSMDFLKNNILFEFYLKLKETEKINSMISTYNSQIRNLEKIKCIEYLYNKLKLPTNLKIEKDKKGIITNIEYNKEKNEQNVNKSINYIEYFKNINRPIRNFIDEFPDFHEYEEEYDNILDIEEKAEVPQALNAYFRELRQLIKHEDIIFRFDKEELENIIYDLENYILTKLYDKLFPSESTKDDIFIYKKCARLSFIKPENVVQDKKLINESLLEQSIEYLNDINDKLTPVDKIKSFGKAMEILQNSINFSSGKEELGVDDVVKPLVYIMIKSKPKNISSNYQYCELFLNSELGKKQYGVILTQIGLTMNIIKNMKYNDLIDVTEKQFGIDEIIEDENDEDDKEN